MALKWEKIIRHLRASPSPSMIGDEELTIEYIQYAIAVEQNLRILEAGLHVSDDANEIAMSALMKACEFYQANWCGFISVDLDLGLWTPVIWYSTDEADTTDQYIEPYESADFLPRWIKALKEDRPMVVDDIETIKDTFPQEYELYRRLFVDSILAVPIRPRPFGFLLVRNPRRYINRPNLLQLLGVVILQQINTMAVDDGRSMTFSPEDIQDDKDILIHLFGDLTIYTSHGMLTEEKINSPLITILLGYLLTAEQKYHRSIELARVVYPDTIADKQNPTKNLSTLIHRLNELFGKISDIALIPPNGLGYTLNSELHIITDLDQFEALWIQAQNEASIIRKVECLKKAFSLYKGNVLASISDQIWVTPLNAHYRILYHSVVNELLKTLLYVEDYTDVIKYATDSLRLAPDNKEAYYWMALALDERGLQEMLKQQFLNMKKTFEEDEYEEFMLRFQEEHNKRNNIAPGKESIFSKFINKGENKKWQTK